MTATASDTGPVGRVLSADRRLGPYTVLAVGGLVGALVTGQPALAAVAAPATVLLVVALSDRRPVHVDAVGIETPARLLEGDRSTIRVELAWTGEAELDVSHTGLRGGRVEGERGWSVTAEDGHVVELTIVAERWGLHDLGSLAIRARRPGGMLQWDLTVDLERSVRVLPAAPRLDELLHPRRPRVAAGAHAAPVRGAGTDFAELRPYVPGDRLRDLSWSASARSDQPWVVVHHPERSAAVVLLLDGFVEVGAPPGALDRAARVVWAIARHHLDAGDRVGLLSTGAAPTWLAPVSGRRARWQVLDALLDVGAVVAGSRRGGAARGAGAARRAATLPADAVVVGVSPLQSDAFVATVVHHARLGRPTAVVAVDIADLLAPAADEVERAARRLWGLEVDQRSTSLARASVPSVVVADDVGPAVGLLAARLCRRERVA